MIHVCYTSLKQIINWAGKLMRLDFFLIIIGILLAVAMVLTLLYGKPYSLHGYGSKLPATQVHPFSYPVSFSLMAYAVAPHTSLLMPCYGLPCRIG